MWYWTNVKKALDLEHHMVEDLLSDVGSVIELSPIIFDLLLQILHGILITSWNQHNIELIKVHPYRIW